MEQRTYLKIPLERVGALIGPGGRVKGRIERAFGVTLNVESGSGTVEIVVNPDQRDVSVLFTVQNIVKAIGRGFSPKRAMDLHQEDYDLLVIDLEDYVGRSKNAIARVKGRVIGRNGKSRVLLEEMTESQISVYGGTVSIIGPIERLEVAREAVLMLVRGAFHKTVWNFLQAYRRKLKEEKGEIWFDRAPSGMLR